MMGIFVNGVKVGTLDDAATLLPKLIVERQKFEIRSPKYEMPMGTFEPGPLDPDFPEITKEYLDRIAREPGGSTLTEIFQRWGME